MTAQPLPHAAQIPAATASPLWRGSDWLIALTLTLLTALSRWPFRTRMIYAWDGGLFARALADYNVIPHHPQPPGYIFYVGAAKAVAALTGVDANGALVIISLVAASLTVGVLYLLTTLLYGRLAALVAAGLGLTSVSFWFFSEIAYPYTTLALGSVVLALLCWLLAIRRFLSPPLAALLFGLIAGFRQDLLLFLGPLFGATYLRAVGLSWAYAWRQLLLGLLAGAAGIATWWIATDLASEGWGSLWRALTLQSANVERGTSAFAIGESGLRENGQLLLWFTKDALHLAAFLVVAYFLLWPLQWRAEGWRPIFLLLWLMPAALFYLLVHIGEAGYVFSFLPACLVAAGAGTVRLAEALVENLPRFWREQRGAVLRVTIVLFLAVLVMSYHAWIFVGSGRLLSAERLACKDEALVQAVAKVQADYPPATTALVTSTYLQHLVIYLPQYHHLRFLDPQHDRTWTPDPGIERVVVFDLELVQRMTAREQWTMVPLACPGRYHLATVPAQGATFTFDAKRFVLEVQR